MANYTQHYQLHQWESTDNFLRTDFNEDLEKIDTAIHAAGQEDYIAGTYTGDGAEERVITLGFTPSVILFERNDGTRGTTGGATGGLAMPGFTLGSNAEITEGGFTVYNSSIAYGADQNQKNNVYRYLAFH